MGKKEFERALEKNIGKSIEEIRKTPVDQMRAEIEAARGAPMSYKSYYPLIGRGNVLRDRVVSHEKVEQRLDQALKRLHGK